MTAEEVRTLQIGETVTVRPKGREPVLCTVAFRGRPDNKFLTYRAGGQIRKFPIRDYSDAEYEGAGASRG